MLLFRPAALMLFMLLTSSRVVFAEDMEEDMAEDMMAEDMDIDFASATHAFVSMGIDTVPLLLDDSAAPTDADSNGTWSPAYQWPIVPNHMVLLTNGKVLSYGTDPGGNIGAGFYYDIWDPTLGLTNINAHQTLNTTTKTNIFGSGQVILPSTGEVLITGGSMEIDGLRNYGVTHSQVFDPTTEILNFTKNNMNIARWHPSVTTLGNGKILVQGGRDDKRQPVLTPEVYNPKNGRWNLLTGAMNLDFYHESWWYPKTYVSGRRVFQFRQRTNEIWELDFRGTGKLELAATVPGPVFRRETPSVMYDRGKVLVIQGYQNASVINIRNGINPTSQPTGSLREPRYWANTVALPNGEILMVGGASVLQLEEYAVKYAEIWSPLTGQWRVAASAEKSRLYHSTALLLPDATVLVGGGTY
jgi:hypothetical protein